MSRGHERDCSSSPDVDVLDVPVVAEERGLGSVTSSWSILATLAAYGLAGGDRLTSVSRSPRMCSISGRSSRVDPAHDVAHRADQTARRRRGMARRLACLAVPEVAVVERSRRGFVRRRRAMTRSGSHPARCCIRPAATTTRRLAGGVGRVVDPDVASPASMFEACCR